MGNCRWDGKLTSRSIPDRLVGTQEMQGEIYLEKIVNWESALSTERHIQRTLLGGSAGKAFFACGKEACNCRRRSSNSEYLCAVSKMTLVQLFGPDRIGTYLMRTVMGPPYGYVNTRSISS